MDNLGVIESLSRVKVYLALIIALFVTIFIVRLMLRKHRTINKADSAYSYMVNPIIIVKEDVVLSSDISWRYIGDEDFRNL